MAYKKSRLDMDSSTSTQEESSSANSGGNTSGTSGPYRARYTRPSFGAASSGLASSNSRYSPYSLSRDRSSRNVPIIRARREDDNYCGLNNTTTSFGSTSSTAQKIMETLASMSTPVLNAGRVRIDSIKSVKPMLSSTFGGMNTSSGTTLSPSSKFLGPPKTSSPLVFSKMATGVVPADFDKSNWSLKTIGFSPKMVECGTNTDDSMFNKSKNKSDSSLSLVPSPIAKTPTNSMPSLSQPIDRLFSISSTYQTSSMSNGEFSFSPPWTLKDLDNYVECEKKETKKRDSSYLSESYKDSSRPAIMDVIPNGDDKRTIGGKIKLENSFSSTPFGLMNASSENKTQCPVCMVYNKASDSNCVCCSAPNPGANTTTKTQDKIDSPVKTSTSPLNKKWSCPTCMVYNEPTARMCVCCSEPNPKKISPAKAPAAIPKWDCPTCMVPNEGTAKACVCCSEKNPNPVDTDDGGKTNSSDSSIFKAAPVSEFKFGFSSSAASSASTTSTTTGFKFGSTSPPQNTSSASTDIVFGFQPPKSTNSSTTLSSSSTIPITATTKNSSNTSTSGFSFGSSSSSKPAGEGSFNFGFKPSSDPDRTTETLGKNTIELWQCDICPSKNKIELCNCKSCGSPRPRELDPNYKKPEEKTKSPLKFNPVFGGSKSISNTQPFPSSVQSSSGSIFSAASSAPSNEKPFGSNTNFTGGSTFSSSSPFGGGNSFGSSGGSNGTTAGFGSVASSSVPVSTSSIPSIIPPFSTPGGGTSSAGFVFGSSSASSPPKRKLDDKESSEIVDSAKKLAPSSAPAVNTNFMFGASSTTAPLKTKEIVLPTAPITPTTTNVAPTNNAGFLEALKNASAAVKASTEKQSNTVTSTSGPLNSKPAFQFGSATSTTTTPASGLGFGSVNTPSFTFGSAAAPLPSASLTIGQNQTNPPSITPAAAPAAPPQFSLAPNFNFGATASSNSTFNFGAPPNPPTGASNFNFGATPNPSSAAGLTASSPPPLFQFSSNAGASTPGSEPRKIKRATRRFNR